MKINKFSCNGFKNLKDVEISPHGKLNILMGENAQGKTNLIEAVWLCTGVRSFRPGKDRDMIALDGEKAEISLTFENEFKEPVIMQRLAHSIEELPYLRLEQDNQSDKTDREHGIEK